MLVYTVQAISKPKLEKGSIEGFVPRLVNGRPVKAWNQWYNKRMKELKQLLPKEDRERVTKQAEGIAAYVVQPVRLAVLIKQERERCIAPPSLLELYFGSMLHKHTSEERKESP